MNAETCLISPLRRLSLWLLFVLMACMIVSLATLNVLTLSSAFWHDKAYSYLSAVTQQPLLRNITSDHSTRWLDSSKANSVHTEVESAVDDLQEQKRLAAKELMEIKTALNIANGAINILTQEKVKITLDRDNFKALHSKVSYEKDAISLDRDHYKNLHTKVTAEHVAFKAKAGNMAKDHVRRIAKAVTRRVASAATQTVPIAGATVTALLIAIDIHETCQSIKDLETLSGPDADTRSWVADICPSAPKVHKIVNTVK